MSTQWRNSHRGKYDICSLKTESCHDANFVVTADTTSADKISIMTTKIIDDDDDDDNDDDEDVMTIAMLTWRLCV